MEKKKEEVIELFRKGELTPEDAVNMPILNGRVYNLNSTDKRRELFLKSLKLRRKIHRDRIPFITPDFLPNFYLSQGLVLVGGMSGQSKSTTAANVIAGFLKSNTTQTVIVISNEENPDAIYGRVACIMTGYNYKRYFYNQLKDHEVDEIDNQIEVILPRIEVVDTDNWDMGCLEDVKAVLDAAAVNKSTEFQVGLVILDYLQTITHSKEYELLEPFKVSKMLGLYLKEYGRKVGIPIIVFAQLRAASSKESQHFKDRVENDRTIYNHAFLAVEIKPDFETNLTTFVIHKDRLNDYTGRKVVMKFHEGAYILEGSDDIL